jgi:hypothetical protein
VSHRSHLCLYILDFGFVESSSFLPKQPQTEGIHQHSTPSSTQSHQLISVTRYLQPKGNEQRQKKIQSPVAQHVYAERDEVSTECDSIRPTPTRLTVKILRSIPTSYGHKLKAQELRRDLLEQIVRMEDKVSEQDRRTISQLLEDKVEVARAAITAVGECDGHAHVADDDDEEAEEEFRRDEYEGRHSQRRRSSNHWREHPRPAVSIPQRRQESRASFFIYGARGVR